MPKDKYEPPSSGRQHRILQRTEIAEGRQTQWSEMEIFERRLVWAWRLAAMQGGLEFNLPPMIRPAPDGWRTRSHDRETPYPAPVHPIPVPNMGLLNFMHIWVTSKNRSDPIQGHLYV
ncbi:Ccr4-not transcription complex subunit 6 [Plakobranchus ocellatus]|uniref:Ccr4-not transcription complex subunit 6 n=1 Tax=Plakobranchus ocellatus TaxID=259542 RepID=A0AAV4A9G5_9GAST|nr:Ccr4-not transcription complex subunit 6 [Plakobranchus ocellatus]